MVKSQQASRRRDAVKPAHSWSLGHASDYFHKTCHHIGYFLCFRVINWLSQQHLSELRSNVTVFNVMYKLCCLCTRLPYLLLAQWKTQATREGVTRSHVMKNVTNVHQCS